MIQSQFNNTTVPNHSPPQFLQTQSLYLPNSSYPNSNFRSTEIISKENRLDSVLSPNQRATVNAELTELKQSSQNPINSFQESNNAINKSSFLSGRTSKYNNKYSFKRHSAVNKTKLGSTVPNVVEVSNDAHLSLRRSEDFFTNTQLAQYKALLLQHQAALKKVRDFAYNRRLQEIQSSPQPSAQTIRNINDLTEVYNLSIVGNSSHLKYLQFLSEPKVSSINTNTIVQKVIIPQESKVINSQVAIQRPNSQIIQVVSQPINIINQSKPFTIVQAKQAKLVPSNQVIVQNNTKVSPVNVAQQVYESTSYRFEGRGKAQVPKQTGYGYESFNYQSKYWQSKAQNNQYTSNTLNINNDSNFNIESYTIEIRDLRNKIQLLEEQKNSLIDKIRTYQKRNGFSNLNTQQTIQTYRQEINSLKTQITELTELYNNSHQQKDQSELEYHKQAIIIMTETMKQYQEQLIQAQNHIIFLENSRNVDDNANLEAEVKYLRETIAKYTQHIEQLDIQRQKFDEMLQQRDQEIHSLQHELQQNKAYIEGLETHIQKNKNNLSEFNGVSYEIYNNLVAEYGRKTLQSIVLLEEISRLNYRNTQMQNHLEKAEEFIIRLQESSQSHSQSQPQNDLIDERLYAELSKVNQENELLITKINELQQSLKNPAKEEKVGQGASTESFMNHQEYQKLLYVLRERQQESRILSQQMKKLNEKYTETREHLQKAEDYIIQLQESKEGGDTERTKIFEEELIKQEKIISQLERELAIQKQQKQGLTQRVTAFTAEYEDMEYRYKTALQSMGQRYDELLGERNALIEKLSAVESRLVQSTNTVSQQEFQQLRLNISQLDQQLVQSRNHLQNAQYFIEENSKFWSQAIVYKERHDQQIVIIQTIRRDLQITQRQNAELSSQVQHFQNLVRELQSLRAENQRLTIVVREKDNTNLSSSLKQIDQIQQTLNNYINLYQTSTLQIKKLQEENSSLRIQSTKASELHEHLLLAENHIIWQEQKIKSLDDFQIKNNELKQHLAKAEQHILFLQDQLQKFNNPPQPQEVIMIYGSNLVLHKQKSVESPFNSKKSL